MGIIPRHAAGEQITEIFCKVFAHSCDKEKVDASEQLITVHSTIREDEHNQGGPGMHYPPKRFSSIIRREPTTLYTLLIFISALFLSACDMSFQKPVMPSWNVTANIPFGNETFFLKEIANDSTIVIQGSDSLLFLEIDGEIDPFTISMSQFTSAQIDTLHYFQLGTLKLNHLQSLNSGLVSFATLMPGLSAIVSNGENITYTINDTTLYPNPITVNSSDFVGIRTNSGQIRLQFTNTLPISVGPNQDFPNGFDITVVDSTGGTVAQFTIDEVVSPGQTIERVSTLPGNVWIYAPFQLHYVIPVTGNTTFQLNSQTLNTTGLALDIKLEQVEVYEAIAKIEEQSTSETGSFYLTDRAAITEAVIGGGHIQLQFSNQTPVDLTLAYRIPNILNGTGAPISGTKFIPKYGNTNIVVDMSGKHLVNNLNPGTPIESILTEYEITTSYSTDFVHISASDRIDVGVHIDSLTLQSLNGILENEIFEVPEFDASNIMDYTNLPTNFQLSNADLTLSLANEIFVEDLDLSLYLIGYHEENGIVTDSAVIFINNQRITPGHPGSPGITTISVPGNAATDFLNILPTHIRGYGQVVANGQVQLSDESNLSGQYQFSTPFTLQITSDAVHKGEVQVLDEKDIDQNLRDAADENLQNAELSIQVTNATPLGGNIRIIVSADPLRRDVYDSTYFNPALEFVKEVDLIGADIDAVTGFVKSPSVNQVHLSLAKTEISIFKNAPIKIGYELRLNGTTQPISLRASDFVSITGLASVDIMVKD